MKLPGLLTLGRTLAKAPDPAPVRLEATLPSLRAARPARTSDSPVPPFARVSVSRPAPAAQFPGATRSVGAEEPGGMGSSKTRGNRTSVPTAVTPGPGSASFRNERRGWWRRRRLLQQRALLLASVRVVRNDLLADDLELIPQPSPAARGLKLGVERAVPSGGWRGWLAHWAHLLGLRRESPP